MKVKKITCNDSRSFIWEIGSQALYVSVVFHHKGTPITITSTAIAKAAFLPLSFSEVAWTKVHQNIYFQYVQYSLGLVPFDGRNSSYVLPHLIQSTQIFLLHWMLPILMWYQWQWTKLTVIIHANSNDYKKCFAEGYIYLYITNTIHCIYIFFVSVETVVQLVKFICFLDFLIKFYTNLILYETDILTHT